MHNIAFIAQENKQLGDLKEGELAGTETGRKISARPCEEEVCRRLAVKDSGGQGAEGAEAAPGW